MREKWVYGLTGPHGAGKNAVVEYFRDKGFRHFSAREFLFKEIDSRGLVRDRDSLHRISNLLRELHGPHYVGFSLYLLAHKVLENCVIESIYTVEEIMMIKKVAREWGDMFALIAIDADPRIRYERLFARKSETDNITFEQFSEKEQRELQSDDPAKHNLLACRELADIKIMNNGTLEDLHQQLKDIEQLV
jgi:dephospho-CoA kinase